VVAERTTGLTSPSFAPVLVVFWRGALVEGNFSGERLDRPPASLHSGHTPAGLSLAAPVLTGQERREGRAYREVLRIGPGLCARKEGRAGFRRDIRIGGYRTRPVLTLTYLR
jgi:hypothetical protein